MIAPVQVFERTIGPDFFQAFNFADDPDLWLVSRNEEIYAGIDHGCAARHCGVAPPHVDLDALRALFSVEPVTWENRRRIRL